MLAIRTVLAAALVVAGAAAQAQGTRVSSWLPDSSFTFQRYIQPFPKLPSAAACRDTCLANPGCGGWTWYDSRASNPEMPRLSCILGSGVKNSLIGRAYGTTAGLVTVGQRTSSFHPNSSMTFYQYFEPFPRVNSAVACRDICIGNPRCTGWTWYEDWPQNDTLRRACILGAGLKDSKIGNRPGRFAGIVR